MTQPTLKPIALANHLCYNHLVVILFCKNVFLFLGRKLIFIICPNLWYSEFIFFSEKLLFIFASLANTSVDLESSLLKFNELNLAYYYHCNIYFVWEEKIIVDSFLNPSDFILERIQQHMSNHFENIHIT